MIQKLDVTKIDSVRYNDWENGIPEDIKVITNKINEIIDYLTPKEIEDTKVIDKMEGEEDFKGLRKRVAIQAVEQYKRELVDSIKAMYETDKVIFGLRSAVNREVAKVYNQALDDILTLLK